jgi:hypothetical protein
MKFLPLITFAILLCAPGYSQNNQLNRLFLVSCILLIAKHPIKLKLDLHHYLFFGWIAWMGLGVMNSDYAMMAFQGYYPYRCQGFLTYLMITLIAVSYWKSFESIKPLAWFGVIACLVMTLWYYWKVPLWEDELGTQFVEQNYFASLFLPDVAISAFACLCGILAIQIHPALSVIAFFPILNAGSRSAIAGMLLAWIICVYAIRKELYFKIPIKIKLTNFSKWGLVAIVAICLISLAFEKSYYFEQRFENLPKVSQMGHGARPQWLLQASFLSQRLPLTGFGIDTLSEYLEKPTGAPCEGLRKYIPDKVHNIAYDIILQTGWIGYTLLLLCFGYAVALALKFPDKQNWVCVCTLISLILFGLLNPHGLICEAVAATALFGIRKI